MLNINHLSKSFWPKSLFDNASLALSDWVKAWLVGMNWSWKSTLLKIILWEEKEYEGDISFDAANPLIWYMQQQMPFFKKNMTILEYIKKHIGIDIVEKKVNELMQNLDDEGVMEEYSKIYDLFERMWGYGFDSECEIVLNKMGLWVYGLHGFVHTLSWGEKNKLLLCAALLKGWDLLLLDEPTNNLDTNAIEWLIEFIKETKAACLIISHDRYFLNQVVDRVFEIDDIHVSIHEYVWNYDFYEEQKELQYTNQLKAHERQQEEFDRIQDTKKALQDKASHIAKKWNTRDNDKGDGSSKVAKKLQRAASAMNHRIEQMDKVDKPIHKKPLELLLEPQHLPYGGIEISQLTYSYSDNTSFKLSVWSFVMGPKDKVLIVWNNGQGKSTFIKLLMWEINNISWTIKIDPSIKIWYFSQEQTYSNSEDTAIWYLERWGEFKFQEVNYVLAKLGFSQDDRKKPIIMLSPWMKSRLTLASLMLQKSNCIIFDEPTNHVDRETIHQLETAINNFVWMTIIVTHDTKFINNINFTIKLEFISWRWYQRSL